jgi:hypothetical protein
VRKEYNKVNEMQLLRSVEASPSVVIHNSSDLFKRRTKPRGDQRSTGGREGTTMRYQVQINYMVANIDPQKLETITIKLDLESVN